MITLLSFTFIALCLADNLGHAHSTMETNTPFSVRPKLQSRRGGNVTLPCRLHQSDTSLSMSEMRVKWTKLSPDYTNEIDVFISMGFHKKSYGMYNGRTFLRELDEYDASLVITNLKLEDYGTYKCEVINGMDDGIYEVSLELQGVVFPYSPRLGRYNLNFHDAEKACLDQDAVVASHEQLHEAWRAGFDWCNAGWLSDGSVQYPINNPREPCGGSNIIPGLRNYGQRNKDKGRYDVFCFTSNFRGHFYYLVQPERLTYSEAVQACKNDDAQIAKVGQMYAAWKLLGYDRCDAGWLEDGSVRYPISNPRRNCSPTEAAVRFGGFPDKKHKLFGVYCFKPIK